MATLIPQELYRSILSSLAPHELCRVGASSRALHHETNCLLYRDVDLHNALPSQLFSWTRTVSNNPHLSVLVRTLCLPNVIGIPRGYAQSRLGNAEIVEAFTEVFGAIVNLDSLQFDVPGSYPELEEIIYYLKWEYFKKSKFRLRAFGIVGDMLAEPLESILFLSNQPDIEDWAPTVRNHFHEDEVITQDMLPASLLPRLAIVRVWYHNSLDLPILQFVTSRQLVRLHIVTYSRWEAEDSIITSMMEHSHQCRHTLLHFRLEFIRQQASLKIIETISEWLPDLKSLSLCWRYGLTSIMMENLTSDQLVWLTASLSNFTRLENLLVESRWPSHEVIAQNLEKRLANTQRLFNSCATLQCITFVETRVSGGGPLMASYRRLDDGQIYLEKDGGLDRNSWREL